MNTAALTPYDDAEAPECWTVETMPYTAQDGSKLTTYRIVDAKGATICKTDANAPDRDQAETARLIAAIPKLMNACKAAWQLAYTLGDRNTQESRDLFDLYTLCDDAITGGDEHFAPLLLPGEV